MWQIIRPIVLYLFSRLKQYWWILVIILLAYSIYKTFCPSIKIVEKTTTITDTTSLQKAEQEITNLNNTIQKMDSQVAQLKKVNKDIQSDIVIVETKYPDGRIERRTEKKIKDSSTTVISSTSTSAGTSFSHSTCTLNGTQEITTVSHVGVIQNVATQKNPVPFWTTYFGYMIRDRNLMLGQGINLNENITIGAIGAYDTEIDAERTWDYGGMLLLRY